MRTIAHISDLHFGRVWRAAAEGLVEELQARRPTLTVISGDLTQRGRRWQYEAAAAYLRRLPVPQLVVPGNHDIPLFDVARRFLWPLDRYHRFITPEMRPVYCDGRLLAMGINTARSLTWKEGRISRGQLDAVIAQVEAAPPEAFKVVVTHHPFLPVPDEPRTVLVGQAGRALRILEGLGVDMLLSGHLHLAYSGDVRSHHTTMTRSIIAVQAGTAISTRRREHANTYNWITLDNRDAVTVELRSWAGGGFQTIAVTRYARVEGQWQSSKTSLTPSSAPRHHDR